MTKPVLYGMSASRAFRSIWAIEEMGVEYEHVPTSFRGDSKTEEYLAINPNGRIPALVDGDFKLFESMAINMYLAKKFAPQLLPGGLEGEATAYQWSVWGISEIEPLQMQIVVQKFFTPQEQRSDAAIEAASKGLARPLAVLDAALAEQAYLMGDEFSLVDLNVAAVMELLNMVEFDTSAWPNVERWLAACRGRESYARAKNVGS